MYPDIREASDEQVLLVVQYCRVFTEDAVQKKTKMPNGTQ